MRQVFVISRFTGVRKSIVCLLTLLLFNLSMNVLDWSKEGADVVTGEIETFAELVCEEMLNMDDFFADTEEDEDSGLHTKPITFFASPVPAETRDRPFLGFICSGELPPPPTRATTENILSPPPEFSC